MTKAQQAAIQARGNVIVVAGAGTGKTRTLIERCISLLRDEQCAITEILLVTFTEAAAAEMRERLRKALYEQVGKTSDIAAADHLRQQLALLDTAHIGTLHSYCLKLIRQHFEELHIDPAVQVLDEKQTAPLRSRTFAAVLRRHYAGETPQAQAIHELVLALGRGSDDPVRELVRKVHDYAQSLENPEAWFARQEALWQADQPEQWTQWFGAAFVEWARHWLPVLQAYEDIPGLVQCAKQLEALAAAQPLPPPPAAMISAIQCLQAVLQDKGKKLWNGIKSELRKSSSAKHFWTEVEFLEAALTPRDGQDPIVEDWQWVAPRMCALLVLTREFTEAFQQAKRELGGVDYADLEQYALRLLRDPATGQPTDTARQWQQRIRYVFVDEYQDINPAQDAIITALSREGAQANRFLVGDVKQSIYRFRRGDPRIFCRYETEWNSRPDDFCARIPLSDNFRSREALLAFINSLFSKLMRPSIGGVGYPADARLCFGDAANRPPLSLQAPADDPSNPVAPRVELHWIGTARASGGEEPGTDDTDGLRAQLLEKSDMEREARLVALRLQQLRNERHQVWNKDTARFEPVDWKDMVILLRSPKGRAEAFAKEFSTAGIPLVVARTGFFELLEVSDLLNVLRLIDNPRQDLPLLGVLNSPLVGMTLNELTEVRIAKDKDQERVDLWQALNHFAQQDGGPGRESGHTGSARSKAEWFLRHFRQWRLLARQSSLTECLEAVLADTRYEALLLALPHGQERLANVRRLLTLAREYDPYQRQGLFRFLRFVDDQLEEEIDDRPASAQTENAVRLMSIHGAKGLEFPVVVLAGMGVRFNQQDLNAGLLLHDTYGLCPRIQPLGLEASYKSVIYWAAAQSARRELYGEELRLWYVALTRAQDTLILVGSAAKPDWREIEEAEHAPPLRGALPDDRLIGARCYGDWLRLWLRQETEPGQWTDDRAGANALLRWRIYAADDPALVADDPANVAVGPATEPCHLDDAALATLCARLNWTYRHTSATTEPAIKSITEIVKRFAEADTEAQRLYQNRFSRLSGPAGEMSDTLSAAEVGSAHHRLLERADLERVGSVDQLREEVQWLLEAGEMTPAEAEALDLEAVYAFWASDLGRRIRACPPHAINREMPFTARLTPADLARYDLCAAARDMAEEYFIVRGVADLVVLLPEALWIVDFKTDRPRPAELPALVERYGRQLKLYGLALGRIYQRHKVEHYLHFLNLRQTVRV